MAAVRQAFIGVGSNLGDRSATLRRAFERIRTWPGIEFADEAAIFETEPVGLLNQPKFLNTVIGIETTLAPEPLLGALLEIEHEFGRVRSERWGPRTLDLDLLAFEGETRATTTLHLPHPRMLERGFVVVPLQELLERSRFRSTCWEPLRQQLTRTPTSDGVTRIG